MCSFNMYIFCTVYFNIDESFLVCVRFEQSNTLVNTMSYLHSVNTQCIHHGIVFLSSADPMCFFESNIWLIFQHDNSFFFQSICYTFCFVFGFLFLNSSLVRNISIRYLLYFTDELLDCWHNPEYDNSNSLMLFNFLILTFVNVLSVLNFSGISVGLLFDFLFYKNDSDISIRWVTNCIVFFQRVATLTSITCAIFKS